MDSRKSNSRFSSELTKTACVFEKSLKGKTATEIRAAARKVYTNKQFEEFKKTYTKSEILVAYAIKVAEAIERTVKINDIERKRDLFSEIISNPGIGLNKAYVSFNPDKLGCSICGIEVMDETEEVVANWVEKDGKKIHIEDGGEFVSNKLICSICKKSSAEILSEGSFYEKDGKRFHKDDNGELVCKSFNSWVVDHIQYPTKNIDKDADKRSQYKEHACPHCGRFVLEGTSDEAEILTCKSCSEESKDGKRVNFLKSEARRSKKSFYNTEVSYLSQPIGNSDDENLTLNNLLFDKDDSEELILRSRLKEIIAKIKAKISGWDTANTGIFKNPKDEAEMFDYFVPSEFLYDESDIDQMDEQEFAKKIKLPNKATGLMIAEKAGYSFPYAVCLDCGLKISLGKNWQNRIKQLKEQGCPYKKLGLEHKSDWSDQGSYDRNKAIAEPTFQYRLGYKGERGLSAGSSDGKIVEFVAASAVLVGAENYDDRRILGLNIELRSYTNGFSDIGNHIKKPLPEGFVGEKEHITQYMHQVANRWMGKLRKDCPKCRSEVEYLAQIISTDSAGRGKVTCPKCDHSWDLREGDFIKRIKNRNTKNLWSQFRTILREILVLRNNNTSIVSVGKAGL